jgi:hypothetical protein
MCFFLSCDVKGAQKPVRLNAAIFAVRVSAQNLCPSVSIGLTSIDVMLFLSSDESFDSI